MKYIAKKVCRFAGHDFIIGDVIPEDLLFHDRIPELLKLGVISEAAVEVDGKEDVVKFDIMIHAEEGEIPVSLTSEEVNQCFSVLQSNTEHAKEVLEEITNLDVLLLLDVSESRKGVSALVKERANQLIPKESEETPE